MLKPIVSDATEPQCNRCHCKLKLAGHEAAGGAVLEKFDAIICKRANC